MSIRYVLAQKDKTYHKVLTKLPPTPSVSLLMSNLTFRTIPSIIEGNHHDSVPGVGM